MELFDVVDENGLPTGEVVERSVAHKEGIPHRTAHIWVVRDKGGEKEVLLQKRSANKDSFPSRYDTSSAGHITAGDEPEISAVRELYEELGLKASIVDLTFVGKFHNKYESEFHGSVFKDDETVFVYVYSKSFFDSEIKIQEEELECVEWFKLNEVYQECLNHNKKFCIPIKGIQTLIDFLGK